MDFRFEAGIHEFIEKEGLVCDADIVAAAGASKNLIDGEDDSQKAYIMKQIGLSNKLHHIRRVIVMNHMDCGGYGGHAAFDGLEAEQAKHAEDMAAAATVIQAEFPDLIVEQVLAHIDEDGKVTFEKTGVAEATIA